MLAMSDITITLPDGSERSLPEGATGTTLAESIGPGLAKAALVVDVDGQPHDLAAPLPMTFAGVSRHIGVLESAGLVQRDVRGRERWVSLRADGLTMAQQWINEQSNFWSTRADALADRLRRKGNAQ